MKVQNQKVWIPILGVIGFLLGSLLVYFIKGNFPYGILIGSITMAIILISFELFKRKQKNNRVPEADEHVVKNIFNYLAYTSHVFLIILFLAVSILTVFENETISLLYLWMFMNGYLMVAGIGGIIVKKR